MSVVTESRPLNKTDSEVQSVLRPAGNSLRVSKSLESKQKNDVQKKPQLMRGPASRSLESVHRRNVSVDSSCSSDSSRTVSSVKMASFRRRMKPNGLKSVKVVPDGVEVASLSPDSPPVQLKRCDWITPNTG
ncbi:uncharacterized protein LOC122065406 [Macadamia integrifolia]|uniref:uncharacterized protein LOC122065406 n=1 Tax=Macadamia integrifolia TaxID=60698 RepID=UPI001C4FEB63|nr:uncharacterized protein LOC122065406 [Macadamia integrifolia]